MEGHKIKKTIRFWKVVNIKEITKTKIKTHLLMKLFTKTIRLKRVFCSMILQPQNLLFLVFKIFKLVFIIRVELYWNLMHSNVQFVKNPVYVED